MPGMQPNTDGLGWHLARRMIATVQGFFEGSVAPTRACGCGMAVTQQLTGKQFKLADEGSYFLTRSPVVGTGLVTYSTIGSGIDLAKPFMVIQNGNQQGGRNISLDYIKLNFITAGGGTPVDLQWRTMRDIIPRWSAGGSGGAGTGMATNQLTGPFCTNSAAQITSNALIWAGCEGANLTLQTASPMAQVLSNGIWSTAAPTVTSTYQIVFASRECMSQNPMNIGTGQVEQQTSFHQQVMLGPGHSFILFLSLSGLTTTGARFEVEVGHVER